MSILIWIAQLLLLKERYTVLPLLEAPVCCLHYFRDISPSISIFGYWALLAAWRTVILCAWSTALLWLTDRLQK